MAAIEPVPPEEHLSGVSSVFFVVPKKDHKAWKAVLDQKDLNCWVIRIFWMKFLASIKQLLHLNNFMTSIELQDA